MFNDTNYKPTRASISFDSVGVIRLDFCPKTLGADDPLILKNRVHMILYARGEFDPP